MNLSNTAINKIGEIIRSKKDDSEFDTAIKVLGEWRESHGKLMDEYYDKCVKLANEKCSDNTIVAQRLKRLSTIVGKLDRFKSMRLSSMQDIAGVRVIVSDMEQLVMVEKHIKRWANLYKVSDYIEHPKKSGYRGKHFVFKKDGMFVEIQLRTHFQHLWATSVETTDVFRGSSLKEKDDRSYWHDFFCQVSSAFAIVEKTAAVPGYSGLSIDEVCNLLQSNMKRNKIDSKINSYALTEPIVRREENKGAYYFVITMNKKKNMAEVSGYREDEYHLAFKEYQKREKKDNLYKQTVMVAVNQIKRIKDAYPNYFLDLKVFLWIIKFLLAEKSKKV